jgi:hypothetical protein
VRSKPRAPSTGPLSGWWSDLRSPGGGKGPEGGIPAGYRLVIHEPKATVVRRIFDLYLRGVGFKTIAHIFDREGVPP